MANRDAPPEPPGLDDILILENVPIVPPSKIDRLKEALQKKFLPITKEKLRIVLPMTDADNTAGYAFIEFKTKQQAIDARRYADGYVFDKNHKFRATIMGEFNKIIETPDECPEPDENEFDDNDCLAWWLHDKQCRDQYVTRVDNLTSVYWARRNDASLIVERPGWSDRGVAWSPRGNYLATFHPQGIKLHGGKNWGVRQPGGSRKVTPNHRFAHPGVEEIDFSPSETYLVTFSPTGAGSGTAMIWDISTGAKMSEMKISEMQTKEWPILKWSHDDKYFARMKKKTDAEQTEGKEHHQGITIFTTPEFTMLDKKSVKIPDVQSFQWSPSDNIISYWVPENGNMPAKIMLMRIPSREEVSTNNMVLLKDCRMVWQKAGDYLCVSAERWVNKNKKNTDTQLLVFSMREKMIPCERVKCEEKIMNIALEPVGGRMAVLVGEAPRISLKIFDHVEGKLTETHSFDKVTANSLHWSPRGQYIVAAGLGSMQGVLEFFDAKTGTSFNVGEHFMASSVQWDPSGRFVVSLVSVLNNSTDTGYYFWTFQGKLVQRELQKNFYQLLWRPRPPTLLAKQQLTSIKNNLKNYHTAFEAEDKLAASAASEEVLRKRRELTEGWEDFQERVIYRQSKSRAVRDALRPSEEAGEMNEIIETEEVFVGETVEEFEQKIT